MRWIWILTAGLGARLVLGFWWWSKDGFVDVYGTMLWPLVGLVVAPLTAIAGYLMLAMDGPGQKGLDGWEWGVVAFAALLDLTVYGTGVGNRRMNKRYRTTQ